MSDDCKYGERREGDVTVVRDRDTVLIQCPLVMAQCVRTALGNVYCKGSRTTDLHKALAGAGVTNEFSMMLGKNDACPPYSFEEIAR